MPAWSHDNRVWLSGLQSTSSSSTSMSSNRGWIPWKLSKGRVEGGVWKRGMNRSYVRKPHKSLPQIPVIAIARSRRKSQLPAGYISFSLSKTIVTYGAPFSQENLQTTTPWVFLRPIDKPQTTICLKNNINFTISNCAIQMNKVPCVVDLINQHTSLIKIPH